MQSFVENPLWGNLLCGCALARVVLGLCFPEFAVFARCVGEKAFMAARLYDSAAVRYGDFAAETTGGQPVADIDCRLVSRDGDEIGVDPLFRDRVHRCGGVIHDPYKQRRLGLHIQNHIDKGPVKIQLSGLL